MSKPITKIEMKGFRGAIGAFDIEFNPGKDLTMLFGENGSGKSSILDAIDVVCNKTIGCLDGISVGQAAGKYLCAIGTPPASLKVTVHSGTDHWVGTMQRNAISVVGTPETPMVKILRRKSISKLITAEPSKRYEALKKFIDIGVVEQSEAALQQRLNGSNAEIDTLVARLSQLSEQLETLWSAEGNPGPGTTSMEWAEGKVKAGIKSLNNRLIGLTNVVSALETAATNNSTYTSRTQDWTSLEQQLRAIDAEIAAAPNVSSVDAVALLESLGKAKAYIEISESLEKCPTCQRPIARQELLDIVNKEFDALGTLKALTDKKMGAQQLHNLATAQLEEARAQLVDALQNARTIVLANNTPEFTQLAIDWSALDEATLEVTALTGICASLESIRTSLTQQRDETQRDVTQFNSINGMWVGIIDTTAKIANVTRIRKGLQAAYDIVHGKRIAFTQSILDGIRKEADRLYQEIHPGEAIGLDQLSMDLARRGSVIQTGVFHGHTDIPPQAIFSESHLDTLGFCVWLALAKRESPEETILLIDDVFSSVDATHLGRVIKLLSSEAPNFLQVLMATHYRLWWDRCQNAQGIERIHLGTWDSTNGIAAQNMPLITDQLIDQIAQPVLDRQSVSSKAGILLESTLDSLTLLYGCSLPHNKQNLYTLGALLNGSGKLFTRHNLTIEIDTNWAIGEQPEDWQIVDAKAAYDAVNTLNFIRNEVGCHFNAPGMEIPDVDVRAFGLATVDLVKALTCPNCGALPTRISNDGTYLRCTCPKKPIKMTPVAI